MDGIPAYEGQPLFKTGTPNTVNQDCVATLTAATGTTHVIQAIFYGYDAAPTAGMIRIAEDGTDVIVLPVTTSGIQLLPLPEDFAFTGGVAVTVTLDGAGAAVKGYVEVIYK